MSLHYMGSSGRFLCGKGGKRGGEKSLRILAGQGGDKQPPRRRDRLRDAATKGARGLTSCSNGQ